MSDDFCDGVKVSIFVLLLLYLLAAVAYHLGYVDGLESLPPFGL